MNLNTKQTTTDIFFAVFSQYQSLSTNYPKGNITLAEALSIIKPEEAHHLLAVFYLNKEVEVIQCICKHLAKYIERTNSQNLNTHVETAFNIIENYTNSFENRALTMQCISDLTSVAYISKKNSLRYLACMLCIGTMRLMLKKSPTIKPFNIVKLTTKPLESYKLRSKLPFIGKKYKDIAEGTVIPIDEFSVDLYNTLNSIKTGVRLSA